MEASADDGHLARLVAAAAPPHAVGAAAELRVGAAGDGMVVLHGWTSLLPVAEIGEGAHDTPLAAAVQEANRIAHRRALLQTALYSRLAIPRPGHRMRNPLQEQLLKAGLVKKSKVAQVVREQTRQRHAKGPAAADPAEVDARRLQAERVERDRALAAERNAQVRANELRAQIRQIVDTHKVARDGEIDYRFVVDGRIRSLLVDVTQRTQLAKGALVIARHEQSFELIPRAAAAKVRERDPAMIVLDHAEANAAGDHQDDDDDPYRQFKVPDDLIW
jgi:uncharacterized protein